MRGKPCRCWGGAVSVRGNRRSTDPESTTILIPKLEETRGKENNNSMPISFRIIGAEILRRILANGIQLLLERKTRHDKPGLRQGCEAGLTIEKEKKTCDSSCQSVKGDTCQITSIGAEKLFDKSQHSVMIFKSLEN